MIPLAAINQLAAVYRGRGRNEAYLEFAQEHFLDWLRQERLFEDETVVLKGGTAIRKFVLDNDGRFSTDLDFAVADPVYADHILERLGQGIAHEGVTFVLDRYDAGARKGTWHAETAEHGSSLPANLDFSARALLLPATHPERARIPGIEGRFLGFEPVRPPVADLVETVAEKLSRFRRTMLGRDVYDLASVARRVEGCLQLLREVLCFKAYFDRVEEGRESGARREPPGTKPPAPDSCQAVELCDQRSAPVTSISSGHVTGTKRSVAAACLLSPRPSVLFRAQDGRIDRRAEVPMSPPGPPGPW